MYGTQRMSMYIYTEMRISHVLELKVKTKRSYKIFKIRPEPGEEIHSPECSADCI
jgi:hypothetical protein